MIRSLLVAAARPTACLRSCVCRFDRAHECTQELAVHLRRNSVHIDAFRRQRSRARPRRDRPVSARYQFARNLRRRACREIRSSSSAPATQPTHSSTLWRISGAISPRVTTSETAKRPPGFSTRKASRRTRSLSAERLITQFEMITSTELSGRGICSISPLQELDILRARFALVLIGQRQHLVGHIETVSLAGGPDPLCRKQNIDAAARAEIKDHFSGIQLRQCSRIPAPQRSEHGLFRELVPPAKESYRLEVIGSQPEIAGRGGAAAGTAATVFTRSAAWPYFSLTSFLDVGSAHDRFSYLQSWTIVLGFDCLVSGAAFGVKELQQFLQCFGIGRVAQETCFRGARSPIPRSSVCPGGAKAWSWECRARTGYRLRPGPPDARIAATA